MLDQWESWKVHIVLMEEIDMLLQDFWGNPTAMLMRVVQNPNLGDAGMAQALERLAPMVDDPFEIGQAIDLLQQHNPGHHVSAMVLDHYA